MKKRFAALFFSVVMLLASVPMQVFAENTVAIDEVNFPDANFRTYVTSFDADKDGYLSEAEIGNVTQMTCKGKSISSLQGIKYFTALKKLNCNTNSITHLNVSGLTELEVLECRNPLTELDVSGCTALKSLDCAGSDLTELILTSNIALTTLQCSNSDLLTELDISNCISLTEVTCHGCALTELDITYNPELQKLYCNGNKLKKLDTMNNENLTTLDCSINAITELNLMYNEALDYLNCNSNKLTELSVKSNTNLTALDCRSNAITELNLMYNEALEELDCASNKLTELDVSDLAALTDLDCQSNSIAELDVSGCTALTTLNCSKNDLTELDLTDNTALTTLICSGNSLTELDITNNTKLTQVECSSCSLTELDVSNQTALEKLLFAGNHLTNIDVSNNTKLSTLGCAENQYDIYLTGSTFDLSTLPGSFDVSKASNWKNGTVDGNILTVAEGAKKVTYNYDCGKNFVRDFTLIVAGTVPSEPSGTPVSGSVSSYAPKDIDAKIELWQGTTKVDEIAGTSYNFEGVEGEDYTLKLNVSNDNACKVGYLDGESYAVIEAEKNADGSYSFMLPESADEIILVVSGDLNGNGKVNSADSTLIARSQLPKTHAAYYELSEIEAFAADLNGNGKVNSADSTLVARSQLPETHAAYQALNW